MEVFADSNYWIAILVPNDPLHARARAITIPDTTRIITSDFVLVEVLNALSRERNEVKQIALSFFNSFKQSRSYYSYPLSSSLFERGKDLYVESQDKEWSVVDCTSFLIMRDRKITDALTHDKHFEQAGFKALLR